MAAKSFKIDPLMLPPFAGFRPGAFAFLKALAKHQDREWFNANRETYEMEAHRPMVALMAAVIDAVAERGLPLGGDPVRSVFRINRDIRFARDKTPYKTNLSAALSQNNMGIDSGVLYIQVAPEGCFTAAGFYDPPKETLDALRTTIAHHPARYRACVAALAKDGLALEAAESLTRLPRGYEDDYPDDIATALKRKSAIVRRTLTRAEVGRSNLPDVIADFAKSATRVFALA